jgi:hypothetical protein
MKSRFIQSVIRTAGTTETPALPFARGHRKPLPERRDEAPAAAICRTA